MSYWTTFKTEDLRKLQNIGKVSKPDRMIP